MAFKPFLAIKELTKKSANVGEDTNCSILYIQDSSICSLASLRTSFQERFLRPPTVELRLMKFPKATSDAEQKGWLSDRPACYQACDVQSCNRRDAGFYMERQLH